MKTEKTLARWRTIFKVTFTVILGLFLALAVYAAPQAPVLWVIAILLFWAIARVWGPRPAPRCCHRCHCCQR